jgi:hypothetical protein
MSALMRDVLAGYAYQILFDGEPAAAFSDCSGLESRQISLHVGVIVTHAFFDWVMQHASPHTLRLLRLDETGQVLHIWELQAARVSKVTATTFTGNAFPFRVEALELSVETVRPVQDP